MWWGWLVGRRSCGVLRTRLRLFCSVVGGEVLRPLPYNVVAFVGQVPLHAVVTRPFIPALEVF